MKTLNRVLFALLSAVVLFSGCVKEEPMDFLISLKTNLEIEKGMEIKSTFVKNKGPLATDKVQLEQVEGDRVYEYPVQVGDGWFTFKLGDNFAEGTYKFNILRGKNKKNIGEVTYKYKKSDDGFKPQPGMTLYGLISCAGKGVKDVVVSDGYEVVKTDAEGYYQMASKKKNGYVFVSIPSGYEVAALGVLPLFHKQLVSLPTVLERVDFELFKSGDQTNHTMMVFGDMHMANRTNDRAQFKTFTTEVGKYREEHRNEKVYALTLGDMTWDLYWYSQNYGFDQYLAEVKSLSGLQIFHTIGNHDHDMNAVGDWDTALAFKQKVCPNYYSFNVGGVHYVVLDDIECTNAKASKTDGSVRTYNTKVVNDDLEWLKKDLAFVPKSTPVVVCMHAPLYNQNGGNAISNASELAACFSGFTNVLFETGHSHKIWNVDKGAIKENNSGAVCGAWWWAGKYFPTLNLAQDGAPNGYRILEVKGKTLSSRFKAIGRDDSYQFRVYDRNAINIRPADCGVTKTANAANFTADLEKYGDYGKPSNINQVILNVWDYDDKWKIEVTENGKPLTVKRVNLYDPLFLIAYVGPRYAESTSITWTPSTSNHTFTVAATSPDSTLEIKVTDDEGRVYSQTMKRPLAFNADTYK